MAGSGVRKEGGYNGALSAATRDKKASWGEGRWGMGAMFDTTFLFPFYSSEIYLFFRKIEEIENYIQTHC